MDWEWVVVVCVFGWLCGGFVGVGVIVFCWYVVGIG